MERDLKDRKLCESHTGNTNDTNGQKVHAGKTRDGEESNTNLESSRFASIVWVLELINRTLVYGILLLQTERE